MKNDKGKGREKDGDKGKEERGNKNGKTKIYGKEEPMKINRLTLYILLPVTVLVLLGAFLAGSGCAPPGTIPRSCQQWYEKGKLDGYNTGYDEGYGRGKDAGYNEGYTRGLQEGMALCPQCPTCPTCPTCPQYPEYSYPYNYYFPYFYWDRYGCPTCEP